MCGKKVNFFSMTSLSIKALTILVLSLTAFHDCYAQSDSLQSSSIHHQLEFNAAPAYLFQTSEFFKGANQKQEPIDNTISYHLKYGFRFADDSSFGRLYPHTYQGIGLSLSDFHNKDEIGTPVSIYLFQGSPICFLSRNLSVDYEWNFGASFGWKQYDADTNPYNNVVGSRINAYINLGFYLNWQIARNVKFKLGGDATHFSNGNTKYPNGGVNSVSLRGGLAYCFDSSCRPASPSRSAAISPFKPFLSYELMIYGAARFKGINEQQYLVPGRFAIVGFNFAPMYSVNRYFKTGLSLDGVYDDCANLENHVAGRNDEDNLLFYRQPFIERISLGLSARAEFVMPIFSINLGLGNDILYRGDSTRGFYQTLALKTSISRNLFVNIGYQLSKFHIPKNLMIGVGYRFHNKRQ